MKKQKAIEEMDPDYQLFIDTQLSKYLNQNMKGDFDSDIEAKDIIGKIINTWNNKIIVEKEKLDTLDEAAKTRWFNSIELADQHIKTEKQNPEIPAVIEFPLELISIIFSGHPGSEFELLPFCWTVLHYLGYKHERMQEIISGSEPMEIEIELLRWAYEIINDVNKALHTKSESKAEEFMDVAYYAACERMENENANNTIIKLQEYLSKGIKKKKMK
jgi:hypothetical protein